MGGLLTRDPPIDTNMLMLQAGGDTALASEVLSLFIQQAEDMRGLIRSAPALALAEALHRIKGSARAIGAAAVGSAAEALEALLVRGAADRSARATLNGALTEACGHAATLRRKGATIGLAKSAESR